MSTWTRPEAVNEGISMLLIAVNCQRVCETDGQLAWNSKAGTEKYQRD